MWMRLQDRASEWPYFNNRWLVGRAFAHQRRTGVQMDIYSLVAFTGLNRSNLNKTLKQFEKDGLIIRYKNPEDRRCTIVDTTDKYVQQTLDFYLSLIHLLDDLGNGYRKPKRNTIRIDLSVLILVLLKTRMG